MAVPGPVRHILRLFRALLAPREEHVVATARDLVGAVPSSLAGEPHAGIGRVGAGAPRRAGRPRRALEVGGPGPGLLLPRWAEPLPPGRVHVVRLAPPTNDPELLWQRFERDSEGATRRPRPGGRAQQRVAERRGGPVPGADGDQAREAVDRGRRPLELPPPAGPDDRSHEQVAQRRGRPIALSDEDRTVVEQRAKESVARLVADGYDIVGDVDELTRQRARPNALRPEDVPDAAVIDMAGHVVAEMLIRIRRESDLAEQAKREAAALPSRSPSWRPAGRSGPPGAGSPGQPRWSDADPRTARTTEHPTWAASHPVLV